MRDFRWQLTGRIEDLSDQYLGGEVRLFGDGSAAVTDSIELRLTPTGPLIDGSTGVAITRAVPAYDLARNIPAGPYSVTATLLGPGGTRTSLTVGRTSSSLATTAPVDFEPSSLGCVNGRGLERSFLYWGHA